MQLLLFIWLMLLPLVNQLRPTECKVLLPGISQSYEGVCRNNLAHGTGKAEGVDFYEGYFRNGLPHGEGFYTWENGDRYIGEWRNGQRHGKGRFTFAETDSSFYGRWKNDEFVKTLREPGTELRSYEIYFQRNLTRARFVRVGDGNKILFNYTQTAGNRPISALNTFGSSGHNINYASFFGFDEVSFPFEGRISFSAPSRTGMVIYQVEMHFKVNEPGIWEIYLFF